MPIHPDRKFTPIYERTPAELDVMIDDAITLVGREHFYTLLGGIDAYLERRARKIAAELKKASQEAADYAERHVGEDGVDCPMKLWKIWQTVNEGWDTYDAAIVAAETFDEAVKMPVGDPKWAWADPKYVNADYLGEAREGTKPGIILTSFNAG